LFNCDLQNNLTKHHKKGWAYHHGDAETGYFVYFKNKKEGDAFVRYSNKFVKTQFSQTNQLYTELYVVWRNMYMQIDRGGREFSQLIATIEAIDFQFNRWTQRKGSPHFIFRAPRHIQGSLETFAHTLRRIAKKQSNTSVVHLIDAKLMYLSFLEGQYSDFHKYSREEGSLTKIINLPILRIVAS